jgi:hypothetical protein
MNPRFTEIHQDQLRYYGKKGFDSVHVRPNGEKKCATRIIFIESDGPIKLGLPFFASVQSVLLDAASHSVVIRLAKNRAQRTDVQLVRSGATTELDPPPRLPEYSQPTMIRTSTGDKMQIEFSNEWIMSNQNVPEYSLILQDRHMVIPNDQTGEFVFVKKYKSVSGRVLISKEQSAAVDDVIGRTVLGIVPGEAGLFHMPKLGPDIAPNGSTVRFNFLKATNPDERVYTVEIENSRNLYILRIRLIDAIVLLDKYDLPKPVTVKEGEPKNEDANCAICLMEYEPGEQVQAMTPHCSHTYHVACLKPWLECHRICCLCRTRIPFKASVSDLISVRRNEEQPPVSTTQSPVGGAGISFAVLDSIPNNHV